jgi:hemerythrin
MVETYAEPARNAVGLADVEAEHALQYQLLSEAERLLGEGGGLAAHGVVRQLYDYSEAHFASEQVLMRLHSYPEAALHEREHGDLLVALQNLLDGLGSSSSASETAVLRRWLSAHIHHSDQAFVQFMQESGVVANRP